MNIKSESAASNTTAIKVLASFPPGSLLQIQEYISIAPLFAALLLSHLELGHRGEPQ